MYALAGSYDGLAARLVHLQHAVGEDPRGIDHHLCPDLVAPPGFFVRSPHADDPVAALPILFQESFDPAVIKQDASLSRRSLGQVDRQPRIVELSVMV